MVKGKRKFALWLTPETKAEVERHFTRDNCKSQSEYIEKAVRFYSGYLDAEAAGDYLPRVLANVLEGKLDALGKQMGHLLFKLAVDENLTARVLATAYEISPDMLQRLRAGCVRAVKETNGEISFEDTVRRAEAEANEWQS